MEEASIRKIATDFLDKCLIDSAVALLEQLAASQSADHSDFYNLAKAYFLNGEARRSLAILEQKGYLSVTVVGNVVRWLGDTVPYRDDLPGQMDGGSQSPFSQLCSDLAVLLLACQCLFQLQQFDDCVSLLSPLFDQSFGIDDVFQALPGFPVLRSPLLASRFKVNPFASLYSIAGRSMDNMDNRIGCCRLLVTALSIDLQCVDALEYLLANNLLSKVQQQRLFDTIKPSFGDSHFWESYYSERLLETANGDSSLPFRENVSSPLPNVAASLVHRAEVLLYQKRQVEDAYKLARQAFTLDPYDRKGLLVYIASAAELGLKSELFYLGHELTSTNPKSGVSWYAVGSYYLCCKKYDNAQKYLAKAAKLDKRLINAWLSLGRCMSLQEESEQAISAFRTAARFAPGDHRPQLFMAKELARTNNFSMALHLLHQAFRMVKDDPMIVNEIGVVYYKMGRNEEAVQYFETSVYLLREKMASNEQYAIKTCACEIYGNLGASLRRLGHYDKAVQCYLACLSLNPNDADTQASIGFAYNLWGRFEDAISHYHAALSIRPQFTMCYDLLNKALADQHEYKICYEPSAIDS